LTPKFGRKVFGLTVESLDLVMSPTTEQSYIIEKSGLVAHKTKMNGWHGRKTPGHGIQRTDSAGLRRALVSVPKKKARGTLPNPMMCRQTSD